jgi:hypothetical protein
MNPIENREEKNRELRPAPPLNSAQEAEAEPRLQIKTAFSEVYTIVPELAGLSPSRKPPWGSRLYAVYGLGVGACIYIHVCMHGVLLATTSCRCTVLLTLQSFLLDLTRRDKYPNLTCDSRRAPPTSGTGTLTLVVLVSTICISQPRICIYIHCTSVSTYRPSFVHK